MTSGSRVVTCGSGVVAGGGVAACRGIVVRTSCMLALFEE
jgi:hypothetical protein